MIKCIIIFSISYPSSLSDAFPSVYLASPCRYLCHTESTGIVIKYKLHFDAFNNISEQSNFKAFEFYTAVNMALRMHQCFKAIYGVDLSFLLNIDIHEDCTSIN